MTWSQVDRVKDIVTLEVGETKNDDARAVYLDDYLKKTFNQLWVCRKRNGKANYRLDQSYMISGAPQ